MMPPKHAAFLDELEKLALATDGRRLGMGGVKRPSMPTKRSISGQLSSVRKLNEIGAPRIGGERVPALSRI